MTKQAQADFTARLMEAGADPATTPTAAAELYAIAQRMHRRNVCQCNHGLTPRQEHADARDVARTKTLVGSIGLDPAIVLFNGDPRGYAVKFRLPTGVYNSWGGVEHGWGIPA